jgi:hypothetical protein
LQRRQVAQHGEVALVGVERVRTRVRRDDDGALEVRLAKCLVRGCLQRKIRQAVVDEINAAVRVANASVTETKARWIAYDGLDAVTPEHLGGQQELRIQVLLLRALVHDAPCAAVRRHAVVAIPR